MRGREIAVARQPSAVLRSQQWQQRFARPFHAGRGGATGARVGVFKEEAVRRAVTQATVG